MRRPARLRHLVWVLRTLPPASRRWVVRRFLESRTARLRRLAIALDGASGRLVFVCHGNIMRSAFATEVARAALPALSARIVGAGTHAKDGRPAQDSARRVAPTFGVSLDTHLASTLETVRITDADVVVCMDIMNEANVLAHGAPAERVFLVGDIAQRGAARDRDVSREVADPYGKGDDVTRLAFESLAALARDWTRVFEEAARR